MCCRLLVAGYRLPVAGYQVPGKNTETSTTFKMIEIQGLVTGNW
jgi:hypothetical protein